MWFIDKCRQLEVEKQRLLEEKAALLAELDARDERERRLRSEVKETKALVSEVRDATAALRSGLH